MYTTNGALNGRPIKYAMIRGAIQQALETATKMETTAFGARSILNDPYFEQLEMQLRNDLIHAFSSLSL